MQKADNFHNPKERNLFELNEKIPCDQGRTSRRNEWLSAVEQKGIKRQLLETSNNKGAIEEFKHYKVVQQVLKIYWRSK